MGSVSFRDGTKLLRTITLTGGVATYTMSRLAAGTHAMTADYLADGYNAASISLIFD